MPEYKENEPNDTRNREEETYIPSKTAAAKPKATPLANKETSVSVENSMPSPMEKTSEEKSVVTDERVPGPLIIDNKSESSAADSCKTDKAEPRSTSDRSKPSNRSSDSSPPPDEKTTSKMGEVTDEFIEKLSGNIAQNRGSRPLVSEEGPKETTPPPKRLSKTTPRNDKEERGERRRPPHKNKRFREDREGSGSRPSRATAKDLRASSSDSEESPKKHEPRQRKPHSKDKQFSPNRAETKSTKRRARSTQKMGFFKRLLKFLGFDFSKGAQPNKKSEHDYVPRQMRRRQQRRDSGNAKFRRDYEDKFKEENSGKPRRNRQHRRHKKGQQRAGTRHNSSEQ